MADVKISGLPASTTPLAGTEVLPIVQGGVTKQVSVNDLTAGKDIAGLGLTLTSTDAGAGQAPTVDLYRNSASPAASDTIGEVEFNGKDSAGNKQAYALFHGSILSPTSGAEQGQLHFETATAGVLTEKMIIGTNGLVINEPGNIFNVRIEGDTNANLFYTDATNDRVGVGTATPATTLDVVGTFQVSSTTTLSALTASTALALNASKNVVSVTNTGTGSNVLATLPSFSSTIGVGGGTAAASGAGITFPATVSLSTDPNTLDDYEEGTYTPIFNGLTLGNATGTSFRYVKVGQICHVTMQITWGSTSTSTGDWDISLPFTALDSGGGAAFAFDVGTAVYALAVVMSAGNYGSSVRIGDGTGPGFLGGTSPFTWAANDIFTLGVTYRTST